MELKYGGMAYQPSEPQVDVSATGESATLGARFDRQRYHAAQRHSQPETFSYRGLRYSQ